RHDDGAGASRGDGGGQVRKNLLFLKKKKQKDFYSLVLAMGSPYTRTQTNRSFFVLFFKKEQLP
ncbi:MAG TPA: hypothetical protein VME92_11165, partial [Acetobacteraceae bacterium]|nr:hypothetical protein [Acetobacteraceae bacterium]